MAALVMALVAGMAVGDGPGNAPMQKDCDPDLEGTWESVSIVFNGMESPATPGAFLLTVKGNVFTLTVKTTGQVLQKLAVKTDPSKTPKSIDMKDQERKNVESLGVYEIKDDRLRLCSPMSGKVRPTEITAPAGSNRAVMTYQRIKPPK